VLDVLALYRVHMYIHWLSYTDLTMDGNGSINHKWLVDGCA
jgi:hypothetical protein